MTPAHQETTMTAGLAAIASAVTTVTVGDAVLTYISGQRNQPAGQKPLFVSLDDYYQLPTSVQSYGTYQHLDVEHEPHFTIPAWVLATHALGNHVTFNPAIDAEDF